MPGVVFVPLVSSLCRLEFAVHCLSCLLTNHSHAGAKLGQLWLQVCTHHVQLPGDGQPHPQNPLEYSFNPLSMCLHLALTVIIDNLPDSRAEDCSVNW